MSAPALSERGAGWEATASLDAYSSLTFMGKALNAGIASVLRTATLDRTIDGASTIGLEMYDDSLKLLRSGIFSTRATMAIDGQGFETVQIAKSGPTLRVVLEETPAAALRRLDAPFKVAANTTTHVAFAHRLVSEVKGLSFYYPPGSVPKTKAPTELARGNPADKTREDSWTALHRLADERGWRVFIKNKTVYYVPETWLIGQAPKWRMTELEDGVEYIDFDFDTGKPVATVKAKVRAARWALAIGEVVEIYNMGPVNGKWIINAISRDLFSVFADVTLTRARPVLPEPKPEPVSTGSSSSGSSGSSGSSKSSGSYGNGTTRHTYNLGPVKPHVRAAAEEVGTKFSVTTVYGVGARAGVSDHPTGYATDFMCNKNQGDAIAEYVYRNAGRLKVKYIIWRQRIRHPGGDWRAMADRGSATANHMDHVHVSYNP